MSAFNPQDYQKLDSHKTSIDGLIQFDLIVNGDNRGWFKENYQKDKLVKLGLPEGFQIVQNNISFNKTLGATRGIHAEPWDKFISIGTGSVFAAIVDLRQGDGFGRIETFTLNPGKAIYVPRGCGNSFQILEDNTIYTYLVNEFWYPDAIYTFVNLADPDLAIDWPINLANVEISDKDRAHPLLKNITPIKNHR
jgi:dTDP-4-dehydrorhamnose 3,5-epimerase